MWNLKKEEEKNGQIRGNRECSIYQRLVGKGGDTDKGYRLEL